MNIICDYTVFNRLGRVVIFHMAYKIQLRYILNRISPAFMYFSFLLRINQRDEAPIKLIDHKK